jgi:hypothetical protein
VRLFQVFLYNIGLYGLSENEKVEKEEELDLKFLDEI